MNASSLARVAALFLLGLLVCGPARAASLVCSRSALGLNDTPYAGQTDSRCSDPAGLASSSKSFGFVDSTGPGAGNLSAGMGVAAGGFGGVTHVSINQVGTIETRFYAEASGSISTLLNIQFLPLAGTAGTLLLPLHVTGGFSGIGFNTPTAAPTGPPTISGSFSFECSSGGFFRNCGRDGIDVTSLTGSLDQAVDETFVLRIPFFFGQELPFSLAFVISTGLMGTHCYGGCPLPVRMSGIVDGDFSHTGAFEAATVLDASGQTVSGATIVSDSGFDYLNPVPEPREWMLLSMGLVSLGLRRGRSGQGRSIRAALSRRRARRQEAWMLTRPDSMSHEKNSAGRRLRDRMSRHSG